MDYEIELWTGFRHKIPLCCILFYENVWFPVIRKSIAEYAKTMTELTDNQGIILCPDCLVDAVKNKTKKHSEKIENELIH